MNVMIILTEDVNVTYLISLIFALQWPRANRSFCCMVVMLCIYCKEIVPTLTSMFHMKYRYCTFQITYYKSSYKESSTSDVYILYIKLGRLPISRYWLFEVILYK